MVLQCYSCILDFFWQILGKRDDATSIDFFNYVPNEVVVDILSRLEAHSVLQCRKVCRNWWKLTSSFEFIELHQRRVAPVILGHFRSASRRYTFTIVDEKSEKERKVKELKSLKYPIYVTCCNGLVLLKSLALSKKYYVLNPLSKEEKITTIDKLYYGGGPCGFFFHPLAKEYRILQSRKRATCYEYHLYLSGAKNWRRTAMPYFYCMPSSCGMACDPAIVNGALHWINNSNIMIFDMVSENFSLKQFPKGGPYYVSKLLVSDERLCVCFMGFKEQVVDIWILEDHVNWYWMRKYNVNNLVSDMNKFPERPGLGCLNGSLHSVKILSIHKDEMKLFWRYRGLFSYHLRDKTIRQMCDLNIEDYFTCEWEMNGYVAYTKSLEAVIAW